MGLGRGLGGYPSGGRYRAPNCANKFVFVCDKIKTIDISVTGQIVAPKSKPNVVQLKWRFDGVGWKSEINLEEIGNKFGRK